jgi:hypothetical protein
MSSEMLWGLLMSVFSLSVTVWTAMGLRPAAKPRYWSSRSTGRHDVRMSRGSLWCFSLSSAGFGVAAMSMALHNKNLTVAGFGLFFGALIIGAFFQRGDIRRREKSDDRVA